MNVLDSRGISLIHPMSSRCDFLVFVFFLRHLIGRAHERMFCTFDEFSPSDRRGFDPVREKSSKEKEWKTIYLLLECQLTATGSPSSVANILMTSRVPASFGFLAARCGRLGDMARLSVKWRRAECEMRRNKQQNEKSSRNCSASLSRLARSVTLRHRRWFYFLFYFLRRDVVRHHQNLVLSALIRLPNSSNFKHENIFILPTMTLFIREHFLCADPSIARTIWRLSNFLVCLKRFSPLHCFEIHVV